MKLIKILSLLTVTLSLASITQAQTWQSVSGTPAGVQPSAIGAGSGNTLFSAFAGSGAYKSTDNGATWTKSSSGLESVAGDPNSVTIDGRSFIKLGNRIIHGTTVSSWRNGVGPGAFYSDNGGATWTPGSTPGTEAAQFRNMVQMGNYAFAADTLHGIVWRSTDNGVNWTSVRNGVPNAPFSGISFGVGQQVAVAGTRVLLATKIWGLYASDDLGTTWYEANNGIPLFPYQILPFRNGYDIVTATNGTVFASVDGSVYHSTNQGTSWTATFAGLPIGNARRLISLGDKIYGNTPSSFYEIDINTYSVRTLPFTGMDNMSDDVFYAYNGYLYCGTSTSLRRLNLTTAPRTNIAPVINQNPVGATKLAGQSHTFSVKASGTQPLTYQWRKGEQNISLATSATYTINPVDASHTGIYDVVVTGPGGSVTSSVATLNVQTIIPGSLDSTFAPNNNDTGVGAVTGTSAAIYAMEALANGELWIGGQWDRVQPNSGNGDAVKVNASQSVVFDIGTSSVAVEDLHRDSQGRMMAAGLLIYPNSSSYTTNVVRILANNTVDNTFKVHFPSGNGQRVRVIKEYPGNKYLIGGDFTTVNGVTRNHLAMLNSDGSLDTSFDPYNGLSFTTVYDIEVLEDGSILVSGTGVFIGSSYRFLLKITAAGVIDTNWNTPINGFNNGYALQVEPNGKILVAGDFLANAGSSGNHRYLTRLNPDGSVDASFNAGGAGISGNEVSDIRQQPDGKILVVGRFTSYNGVARTDILRLLENGQLDTAALFPTSPIIGGSQHARSVSASPDGQHVYVGYDVGSSGNNVLVRYLNSFDNPTIAAAPATTSVAKNGNARIKAVVYSTSAVTYQWYKNGVLLDGQTTDTLTLDNVQESDSAQYTFRATTQGQTLISPPAEVRVLAAPVIASAPASLTILAGKPFSLFVDSYGLNISNRWYFNGAAIGGGIFQGTNTARLTNSHIRWPDNGLYQMIATNTMGRATASVQVVVLPQPGHLSPTFGGISQFYNPRFGNTSTRDDSAIVSGTNVYLFGVYGFGGQERYGIGRTDFDLNIKDVSFNPPFSYDTVNNPVGGIAQSDGKLVIYGTFNNLSNYTKIMRLNTDGSVDTTFKTNGFPDQNIEYIVGLPNDKFMVWGSAITKIGTHATKSFALYNADGSPDTSFSWGTATTFVTKLMAQPDGKVLVGGSFTTFNGQSLSNLVRINLNGTVDSSFYGTNVNGQINDFDLMEDGRIVVGGYFTAVGGFARGKLARLLPDGSRDTSFTLTNRIDATDNGAFPPTALVVDDEGGIFVGGTQIMTNGVYTTYGFRIGPDGKHDPECIFDNFGDYRVQNFKKLPDGRILMGTPIASYNNKIIGISGGFAGGIGVLHGYPTKLGIIQHPLSQRIPLNGSTTLRVTSAGQAVATYQWYKDGLVIPGATGTTLPINNLQAGDAGQYSVRVQNVYRTVYSNPARIEVLGVPAIIKQPVSVSARLGQTVTFEAEAVGLGALTYQWQKDGVDIPDATTPSLSLTNVDATSSAIYRLKAFNSLAPAPAGVASQGAALSVSAALAGTVDTSFAPGSGVQRSGTVLGFVEAVLWDSVNKPVVGGFFDTINGTSRPNLARFNNDGSPDTTFASAGGPNNYVFDIIKTAGGQLYIGGSFSTYASVTQNRVARLNADGSRDSNFASTTAPGNNVYRIVEATDGKIFAGHNGTPPCVWKYNNTGTRDTGTFTFSANYSSVYALSLYGNNQMLVGGNANSAHYSYRYGTNGTFDNTWTAASSAFNFNSYLYDVAALPDGRALVGGTFANPDSIQGLTNLVVLGTNGRIVANTSSNLVTDGVVYDIYVYPNGKVLIGGNFTNVNRIKRPGIARLNADLSVDTTFDPGQGVQVTGGGAAVYSIDVRNDGKILAGGYFESFDGAPRNGVVVLNGDPTVLPLNILSPPQAQVVVAGQNATFNVAVNGGTTLNFQWYKGVDAIPGANLPYLTITNATFNDAANYKVTITSGADSTTSTPVSLSVTAPTTLTFADWRSGYVLTGEQIDPDADPDGDGLPNVVEYVLGTNPTQQNERPKAQKTNVTGTDYPAVKIKRLKAATGFDILVEASLDINFGTLVSTTLVGVTDIGNGMEEITVRINDPLINTAQVFFRVKVATSVSQ